MKLLERIHAVFGTPPLAAHIAVGKKGEWIAMKHLRHCNYRIIDHNVRVGKHDEIDIVAWDPTDKVYVFAEVKTRSRADVDFRPELNVTYQKKLRMARAARRWMVQRNEDVGYRLDVLCIVENSVANHFIDVH